jgi:hypothetical protein
MAAEGCCFLRFPRLLIVNHQVNALQNNWYYRTLVVVTCFVHMFLSVFEAPSNLNPVGFELVRLGCMGLH